MEMCFDRSCNFSATTEEAWGLGAYNSSAVMEKVQHGAFDLVEQFGMLFYIVNPFTSMHRTLSDVPDYFDRVMVASTICMVLEVVVRFLSTHHDNMRAGDIMASMGSITMYSIAAIPSRALEIILYNYTYKWRLVTFDWDSLVTWVVAAIVVDFLYYWFHRTCHETTLLWSGHQVHHGSEDYNLTTSLRQSALLKLYSIIFYLPLGLLGVPLTATITHMQFNLVYQLWIHTELVTTLGPLEWVLNTASHHRVHHGSEAWCLDKNYGGVLIIWDKMFGTFQPEIEGKPIVYGLVDQPQSLNTIYLETFYYKLVWDKLMAQKTWSNRFKALFYGPGWTEGSPRLGHPLPDRPADQPIRKKYDPQLPLALEAYLMVHFFIGGFVQREVLAKYMELSGLSALVHTLFAVCTLMVIGGMYDGWRGAIRLEVVRLAVYLHYAYYQPIFSAPFANEFVLAYLLFSLFVWSVQSMNTSYMSYWLWSFWSKSASYKEKSY